MIRDNHWYNNNEQRPWPFDDIATLVDDQGQLLDSDILADLHLTYPSDYGERAFLGSLFLGPAAVGLVIISDTGRTLASFSQARPLEAGRVYRLASQSDGAGGWVVWGGAIEDLRQRNHRFSNLAQSLLLVRTATAYRQPPVTSFGKLHASQSLTGLVRLTAGSDIAIEKTTLTIAEEEVPVILFSLSNSTDDDSRNLLDLYSGSCGGRPETKNCGDPQPIEAINTITPDCCGTIYIEMRGCAEISRVQNDTLGVVIDCGFSLADACITKKHLPDASGKLPNEYDDSCDGDHETADSTQPFVHGVITPIANTTPTTPTPTGTDNPPFEPRADLPWMESFEDGAAAEIQTILGEFTFVAGSGGSGYSLGGDIDIIIPDTASVDNSTIVFETEHGLALGDRIAISNAADSDYDGEHVVVEIPAPNMAVIDAAYTTDSSGGVWFICNGASTPTAGGSCAGTVNVTYSDGGFATFSFNQTHTFEVGHILEVAGSTEAAYNASHTTAEVLSTTIVSTDTAYTADAYGGYFVRRAARSAGRIVSIVDHGDGRTEIETSAAHSLALGDRLLVLQNSSGTANRVHTVSSTGTTTFATDIPFGEAGTGGLWILIDGPGTVGNNYATNSDRKCLAIWNGDIPNLSDWRSRFITLETVFTISNPATIAYYNGGLVFNYQDDSNFFLAELSFDSGKQLLLWQVVDGAYNLLASTATPTAAYDSRYRLTVSIDQYSALDTSGRIKVQLTGLQDGLSALIGPDLRVPTYMPDTGKVGLHGHYTTTVFEYLSVRNLER
jgi:hypothetical protein